MVGDILQPTHLIFVLVIALLVLGPKRLPEVGRTLGRGLRDFRMAISGVELEPRDEVVAPDGPVASTASAVQPVSQVPVAAVEPVTPAESVAEAASGSVPVAVAAPGSVPAAPAASTDSAELV